ncbi:hypothetical protein [Aureimonas pseudogalii]|uniref:PilZ domain-containing protein n=1 Tax=Aureimonas pseudogalii TaxID=1744844 RepID=A0A7W6E7K4_9HYPH|nr:hypothetical protein [Aureimonas pseudogalii]MBB3996202.1 hypothetical protein [Aureimonas pseudogalii]
MIFERRRENRSTTRLRPGKLITETGRFLCDCAVIERSPTGARVRAFAPVDDTLPEELFLFDEVEAFKWRARIIWAKGAELGLELASSSLPVDDAERHRIAGRFYAVGN